MNFSSFAEFEKILYGLSKKKIENKKDASLMSPATFVDDDTHGDYPNSIKEGSSTKLSMMPWYHRKNVNVMSWGGWAAVDVDEHKFEGNLEKELYDLFGTFNYVCYSTASSTSDHPKFRLVFPLDKRVPTEKIKHFWFALNTEIGNIGDAQTKDLSRMYYIPATYSKANNFIFSNHNGVVVNVDALLEKHPYVEKSGTSFFDRLPKEVQDQIIEHRKSKLDQTNYSWNGYRDCPFFPNKMAVEYAAISETGWYYKLYQIMVATASNAIRKKYPISSKEIADLCRELDMENGNWYISRPLEKEAARALEYVYKTASI